MFYQSLIADDIFAEGNNMDKTLNKTTEDIIIDVSTTLFAQKGFYGTSIRDICNAADVNISLISYYFGGKEELYKRVVEQIVNKVMGHMKSKFKLFGEIPKPNFNILPKRAKVELFLTVIETMADFFYSKNISDDEIMIIFREQITSGIPINSEGYDNLRRLLASIIGKDENDKEVIFRCITIIGQVHSARVIKQFSLKMMGQSEYSPEDTKMFKNIVISQTKTILKELGAL